MSRSLETSPDSPRRRGKRPPVLLIVLGLLLAAVLAAGVVAAVYVSGLARAVDEDTQRFDQGAFPADSLRPGGTASGSGATGSQASGAASASGDDGTVVGDADQGKAGLWTPTAPPPGMDPALAAGAGAVQGPEAPAADEVADGEAVDILLVGEDSGLEGRASEGRSDTMMWLHVPGDRSSVRVMSVMRDLWVPIPGHGDHKVNAAYQYGGIPLTVATVENMFQTRVDHVIAVDMAGFQGLVDALGGVTVQNPTAFTSTGGKEYAQGSLQLDGESALFYARERYNLPRGDYDRVENQQRLVKAIVSKFLSMDTLSDPARVQQTVERFAPYLTLDDSLDSGTLASLAWSMRDARDAPILTSTVPNLGVGTAGAGQSVVWPDWEGIRALGKGIRTGTLDGAR